uniref:Peptidase A2 domain-containing protein n=1 Tax=Romanomermis culicivorax TaxID=13658 RepID=A0A915J713_ROMCU
MGVIISFVFGILLSLCDKPGGIFTSPEKAQVPFYTNFPAPYYPNPVAQPVAAPNQNIPRLIGGKKRPITQSELDMANKYSNVALITIPVQIFGHTVLAAIDTGDTYSTIYQRPAEDILHKPIHSFQPVGQDNVPDGSTVRVYGPIFANATTPFGSILLPLTLTLGMEPGGIEMLLGLDFLFHPAIKAIMDFGTSTLSIQGKTIPMGKVVFPSINGPEAGYRTM